MYDALRPSVAQYRYSALERSLSWQIKDLLLPLAAIWQHCLMNKISAAKVPQENREELSLLQQIPNEGNHMVCF